MKKILIADDEKEIVEILITQLKSAGYEICAAYEGVRAIEFAHKQKPDLILLDLKMPVGTGESVLEVLRSQPDTKGIPVVILTALQQPGLRDRCLSEGAQGFVEKPYDPEALLAQIRALLAE